MNIGQISEMLLGGAVGVLPTDTVYGLVARAVDRMAVGRLYELKSREQKPGTIIAASVDQLVELGVDGSCLDAVARFWPNPISVVISVDGSLDYLSQTIGSLAFRVVADPEIIKLLNVTGPLLTSSANLPGQPVASTVTQAKGYFGNQVDFYVDGGDLSGRLASTIIKLEGGIIRVLRQGSIKVDI